MAISEDDLAGFEALLADLSSRLKGWNAPLDALIREALEKGRVGDGLEDAKRLEAERSRGGQGVPNEIRKALGDLCEAYVIAQPAQRARIRGMLEGRDNLRGHLYGFIAASAGGLRSAEDRRVLERALAAAAIEDARLDFRDLLVALGDLWLAAERAGIDPAPAFREASETANAADLGGAGSTRDLLRTFHASAHLRSIRGRSGRDL